jgi:hypothetical protein
MKGVLKDRFGLAERVLAESVFPDSAGVKPMQGWSFNLAHDTVMPGRVPGIHVLGAFRKVKTWMAGASQAMTK